MPKPSNFRRSQRRGLTRREILQSSFMGLGLMGIGGGLVGCGSSGTRDGEGGGSVTPIKGRLDFPELDSTPDENGLLIPKGFKSRVIAQANQAVGSTGFRWHTDPDGSAVFAAPDGGWVYASNREFLVGGVNAIRFDAQGEIVSAYNILPGLLTRLNCGGGVTPWGTWLSGEEYDLGVVWECDPFDTTGRNVTRWSGLGTFYHEAVAVDDTTNVFYETEDRPDGRFYRFVPDTANVGGRPSETGKLQALRVITEDDLNLETARGPWPVDWHDIPRPNPGAIGTVLQQQTRYQVEQTTAFNGGEGIWYQAGMVYFTTKGDRRVWALDIAAQTLEVLYDDAFHQPDPILDSVDNLVMTPGGDIIVVEDKGEPNQQAVAIKADGSIAAMIQLVGHMGSEVTGPAFSPDGRFFYFSSQRGPGDGKGAGSAGITYAVEGPWFTP
ncbi:alkaline phosphatase PhoX [Hydrocarboniphaga effusa]|uniref:alkaline phosphatase PhoX n=1 Tax=Hydrocarboniphaga effusa TaxID=243629 RepID=UPI00313776EE